MMKQQERFKDAATRITPRASIQRSDGKREGGAQVQRAKE